MKQNTYPWKIKKKKKWLTFYCQKYVDQKIFVS